MNKEIKTVKIKEWVHKKLKVWCVENGRNMSEIVESGILSFIADKPTTKKKTN